MARFLLVALLVFGIGYGVFELVHAPGATPLSAARRRQAAPAKHDASTSQTVSEAKHAGTKGKASSPPVDIAPLLEKADRDLDEAKQATSRSTALAAKDRARVSLSQALFRFPPAREMKRLQERISELNRDVLFSDSALPGRAFLYKVEPGDRLWTLCNRTFPKTHDVHVEPGLLLYLNGMKDAKRLHAGATLKVPTEPLSILVSKSRFRLWVLLGGVYLDDFPVAIGSNDRTPEGTFQIETKLKDPAWYSPEGKKVPFGSPDDPLGTRWMGFKNRRFASGYGIHGTNDPSAIGKAVSAGCVRMRNQDVERLFSWVARGTKVKIVR